MTEKLNEDEKHNLKKIYEVIVGDDFNDGIMERLERVENRLERLFKFQNKLITIFLTVSTIGTVVYAIVELSAKIVIKK